MQNKNDFSSKQVENLLKNLSQTSRPLWGIMTPQHAVEHLTISVKASVGKTKPIVVVSKKEEAYYKKVLLSDDSLWPQGLKNPLLPEDKLLPLRYATLEKAKDSLIFAVKEFEHYYTGHPHASHPNPFLGHLKYEEWQQFHFKHFRHHFIQFGLLENLYNQK